MYDQTGDTSDNIGMRTGFNAHDIDPQEIFREFFGGGFANDANVRTFYFGNGFYGGRNRNRGANNGSGSNERFNIMQLIPVLLLLFMSFGSLPSHRESIFSLQRSNQFNIKRVTSTNGIVPDIPFFVDRNFKSAYARDARKLHSVETEVQSQHISRINHQCRSDKLLFSRKVENAKRRRNEKQLEELLSQGDSSACQELERLQSLLRF